MIRTLVSTRTSDLLPGFTATHARWLLGYDVGAALGARAVAFDENPAPATRSGQAEPTGKLVAEEQEGEVIWLLSQKLDGPLVPDDDRSAAAKLSVMYTFEVAAGEAVVRHLYSEPSNGRVE